MFLTRNVARFLRVRSFTICMCKFLLLIDIDVHCNFTERKVIPFIFPLIIYSTFIFKKLFLKIYRPTRDGLQNIATR